jgi:hypothetical protein
LNYCTTINKITIKLSVYCLVTDRDYKTVTPDRGFSITIEVLSNYIKIFNKVGFEVFMAASMNMAVIWVVAPCSLVEVYRRFRGACCLHHQGVTLIMEAPLNRWYARLHGATTQKTAIF